MVRTSLVLIFLTIALSVIACNDNYTGYEEIFIFPVIVDYDLSVEELVAMGEYDDVSTFVNSDNFSTSRRGIHPENIYIVRWFGTRITDASIVKRLDDWGLRPANLHELLVLGIEHQDLPKDGYIHALGSVWDGLGGNKHIPYLLRNDSGGRNLGIGWLGYDWGPVVYVAAVPK